MEERPEVFFSDENVNSAIDQLFTESDEDVEHGTEVSYMLGMAKNRKIKQGTFTFQTPEEAKDLIGRIYMIWHDTMKNKTDLILRASFPTGRRIIFMYIPGEPLVSTMSYGNEVKDWAEAESGIEAFMMEILSS